MLWVVSYFKLIILYMGNIRHATLNIDGVLAQSLGSFYLDWPLNTEK